MDINTIVGIPINKVFNCFEIIINHKLRTKVGFVLISEKHDLLIVFDDDYNIIFSDELIEIEQFSCIKDDNSIICL